ncbi:GTPase HflX [Labilithrix luteola]|nr:GTPase HflX [Labilithrix luteola]
MPKFTSKAISEHIEVPLADDGQLETLVEHWDAKRSNESAGRAFESASYVVSVGEARDPRIRAAQMDEIVSLVESQGGHVVGQEVLHLSEPNPRTLLGKGTAEEVAARARAAGATMLVLDAELSPSQTRNLEDVAGIPICDREAIILNVFLRHARTRRAKLQVELAQLQYLRPRIRGVGLDMDQQTGATKNARGPGETASELMARKLDRRLEELQKALRKLTVTARTQRLQRTDCHRIVLVGYTNAGKTSLMNALTNAGLSARDMPFETLDTTSRCLTRHGGDVLICDTVGFIRRLPERLLASFESTLAEVVEASLLVIVVDTSDYERQLQLKTTLEILERMGAADIPRFYVFNKRDRLPFVPDEEVLERWSDGHPHALISTTDPNAVTELQEALLHVVRSHDEEELTTFVPYGASEVIALAYGRCRVVRTEPVDDGMTMTIQGPIAEISRVRRLLEEVQ